MIELTEEQLHALENAGRTPPHIVHPQTKEEFVLLPLRVYERLKQEEYDDSPWTREEIEAAAWELAERSGSDWDEYDNEAEKQ